MVYLRNFFRQVLGLKPSNKQDINLEEYYEKSKRENSFKEEHVQSNMVDPADALPVKTLSGELHYRTTKLKSLPENDGICPLHFLVSISM
jgi:hypothetical protein